MAKLYNRIASYFTEKYARWKIRQKALMEGKRMCLQESNYIFQSRDVKAKFYLPYYKSEFIQQLIVGRGNYYDYNNLKYVTEEALGGAILNKIKGNIVLDIGANVGNHSLFFLLECDAGLAYCFEPIADVFSILKRNMEINGLQNKTILFNVGVGAKASNANIQYFNEGNMGNTSIVYDNNGTIPIIAVDDMDINGNIALVKIDVEGFELEVIKGMVKTLAKHRPYVMIEIREKYFCEVVSIMKETGYWWLKIGGGMNFLFIPTNN